MNVKLFSKVLSAAPDSEREQGRGQTTSVAEQANTLALKILAVDVGEHAAQATVDAATVHVTALGWDLDTRLDAGSEALLGKTHECLLDSLVADGSGIVEVAELSGNLGKNRVGGVDKVVVVEHTRV